MLRCRQLVLQIESLYRYGSSTASVMASIWSSSHPRRRRSRRDLFEHQLFDFGSVELLDEQAGRDSMSTVSPARSFTPMSASDSSATRSHRPGRRPWLSFRPPAPPSRPRPHLSLTLPGQDHVQGLVEHDLVAPEELAKSMSGWSETRILRRRRTRRRCRPRSCRDRCRRRRAAV